MMQARRWLEPLLATVVAALFAAAMLHLAVRGHLPAPYLPNPMATWQDWFSTAYWAHDRGAYDVWGTIYPPLSFLWLRLVSVSGCYGADAVIEPRGCDWLGAATLHGAYVLDTVLIGLTFSRIDRRTALPRSIAFAVGLPMTYALDRGNLVLVALACVILGFGPLLKSARLRWLAAGLAVNFKVYLVAGIMAQLLRRRWRWFEGAAALTMLIYLATFALLGHGTPIELYRNIMAFTEDSRPDRFTDIWYATSYGPAIALLVTPPAPLLAALGQPMIGALLMLLPLLVLVTQLAIIAAAAAAWLRPEAVPPFRLTGLAIGLALISSEAGGYTQVLIILFAFMEPWRGAGRIVAILAAYLLCLPADVVLIALPPLPSMGWLGGGPVIADQAVTLGPLVRPALVLAMPLALACVTIAEVRADVVGQGWRDRWRFRHDRRFLSSAA